MDDTTPVSVKADTEVVADLATAAVEPKALPNGGLGIVVPAGGRVEYVDPEKYADRPTRKRGIVALQTVDSLIEYVKRHATPGTEVYVDADGETVTAVIDDHAVEDAGHGDHRARLSLQHTPEWDLWNGEDGVLMSQDDFAQHIEDGLREVREPDPATMMEVAQTFHAAESTTYRKATRLTDGTVQLQHDQQQDAKAGAGGDMVIPTTFTLGIAPYVGEQAYAVKANLRWRLRSGELRMGYRLDRPDAVLRDAVQGIVDKLSAEFDNVYMGSPR